MSEKIQRDYIASAITKNLLPANAHRVPEIVSLNAPNNASRIQLTSATGWSVSKNS